MNDVTLHFNNPVKYANSAICLMGTNLHAPVEIADP